MSLAPIPDTVIGVAVRRVLDTWIVDDLHGSRSYCKLLTVDDRLVTMLRTEQGWHPTIIEGKSPPPS